MGWNPIAGSNLFALKVALCVMIGYSLSVGVPTYLDPLIKHHVAFGARVYPYGYLILIPGPLLAILAYRLNVSEKFGYLNKALFTSISLIIVTWATLPYFRPETPHIQVFLGPICFGLIISISIYIHHIKINFDFVHNNLLSESVKIEKIKLDYDIWMKIFLTSLTTYGAIFIGVLAFSLNMIKMWTPVPEEQFRLVCVFGLEASIYSVIFIIMVSFEFIRKIACIKEKLTEIKTIANAN
jgi:hypothetical protein